MNVVENYLHTLESKLGFSGSALVAYKGNVVSSKGYGYANYDYLIENTPKSKFNIGSITKQITAAAIYILVEQGLLKTSDTLAKHLPNLPTDWNQVTIIQLLTHTSGIPDYVGLVDWQTTGKYFHKPLDIVSMVFDKPLDFKPGSNYSYCATGYMLLGILVELISEINYSNFLKEYIFDVLQLTDTGVYHNNLVLPARVSGYEIHGACVANQESFDMSFAFATGDLYSTIEDLYLWHKALFTGELLLSSSLKGMMTPSAVYSGYGSGLEITDYRGGRVIGHKGEIGCFSSIIRNHINEDLQIIVLSNLESCDIPDIEKIATTLADAVLEGSFF